MYGPARVVVLPRGSLILPRQQPPRILLDFRARTLFYPIFGGSFGGLPGTQNGSCGISSESSRRPLSNDIKFARIGVRTRELWLPEVGVSELFLCTFPDEDSGQTGDAIGEPRVPRRSRSHYLSNAPGLADQLVASRKDSAREGGCVREKKCVLLPAQATGVFLVRLRAVFRSGFRLDPDKFLAIREFHVVHGCVLLSNVPGLADQLVASQEDSVRKRGNVGGKIPEALFSYFVGLFSRAWPCTEASLGSQDMILANGGRRNVPYAKGGGQFDPVFGLVNGPVKPWSNLVNLGQTWSNLVKALQTLGNVSRTYISRVSGQRWTLVGLETARSNLVFDVAKPSSDQTGLVRAVLVLRADTRENPGLLIDDQFFAYTSYSPNKLRSDLTWGLPKLQIGCFNIWNLSPNRLRGDLTWGPTQVCKSGGSTVWNLSPNSCKSGGSTVWNLSPNRLRSDLTWGLPKSANRVVQRFGISVQTVCKSGGSTVWNLSPNRLRGDRPWVTTQVCKRVVQSVWNLSPNRPEGDLTWGLPKLQIGWFNGLESQSKHVEDCKSGGSTVWNLSPNKLRGDLTWGLPKLQIGGSTVWNLSPNKLRSDLTWGLPKLQIGWFNGLESQSKQMSDRGSGSGGHRRSDRLAKGKAVAYAPESSPDTDDEYDAMEDVRTRVDASLRQGIYRLSFDAEAAGSSSYLVSLLVPSDAPSAAPRRAHTRSTGILPSRLKRQRSEGIPDSAGTIPEDYVAPGFRYPPHGGIRPRYPVAVEISDTPLLTNLLAHPSSLVRRCQEPPYSAGRGGWSEFSRLLAVSRPEYREFLIGAGLRTCEMAVLPVDWSAILGIRFGGRAPPSEPIDGSSRLERFWVLLIAMLQRATRRPSVRIRYLADVLRRDREEPPTELRYRQWAAILSSSAAFSGTTGPLFPRPFRSAFLASGSLPSSGPLSTSPLLLPVDFRWLLTRISLLPGVGIPSRIERMTTCTLLELRMTVDCLRDADIIFQPYSAALSQRPEVFRAVALSRLRLWIRTTRSWELLLGERTVRQLGDEAVVPVDPSPLMTIEDYIPRAPSDPYIAGVSAYPSLVREGVPYQEWFEQVSLGSLMSLHEVEGGRVMGGVAMDSHHIRSSGQIERLEGGDGPCAGGADPGEEGEMVQMQRDLAQSQRDLGSRDAEVALLLLLTVRRLEDQLHGMGITPVTGADLSGPGQPSSSPPRDPVSRDWFFDDPSSSMIH
uniref:Uncharacterized protein n=1 Tax=Fagus sylvatica TaxID=28930 RepID=A0A2N9FU18_FAGSY